MDGSVLAVLAAYQNNLVTSKMMTSQVVQCLLVENVPKIRFLAGIKLSAQPHTLMTHAFSDLSSICTSCLFRRDSIFNVCGCSDGKCTSYLAVRYGYEILNVLSSCLAE